MATCASRTIKSAHRVLEILEYFDQDRQRATVMDLSRELSYPQSSTSELLRCLKRLGYLHYDRAERTYRPTARVALLGAWVKPDLFHGGPILAMVNDIARLTNEATILSTSDNYVLRHLHVVHGENDALKGLHCGDEQPLLHSAQGRLLLSSYRNENVRSAVHRLNAEDADPEHHVRVADVLDEFAPLRERRWIIEEDRNGVGCVAVILPLDRGNDRLAISIMARSEVIAERGEEMLQLLLSHRDQFAKRHLEDHVSQERAHNVVDMSEARSKDSYLRQFA